MNLCKGQYVVTFSATNTKYTFRVQKGVKRNQAAVDWETTISLEESYFGREAVSLGESKPVSLSCSKF